MSYILEALKKADAERKLGAVPGLHMQSVPAVMFDDSVPLIRRPLTWGALALILAGVMLLLWYKPWKSSQVAAQPEVSSSSTASGAAGESMPPALTASQASPANARTEPMPEKDVPVKAKENQGAQSSGEHHRMAEKTERKPSSASRPASASAEAKTVVATVPAKPRQETSMTGQMQPAEPQVIALRDLPEHVQRSLPQLMVGGYIYSSKPSERSMLINNRLVREGESISSGLVLEKMLPNKEAVFNFQGQRYRMSY